MSRFKIPNEKHIPNYAQVMKDNFAYGVCGKKWSSCNDAEKVVIHAAIMDDLRRNDGQMETFRKKLPKGDK